MPCYKLSDIQALAQQGRVLLANARARRNVESLGWEFETLCQFVCALAEKHYRGTQTNQLIFDGRASIDVDEYRARFDEESLIITSSTAACMFFVKLAIRQLPGGGATALVVSIHLDGQP